MEKTNLENSISELISLLKDKEKEILTKRFGLFNKDKKTLAAIGKELGLTRERIRQIQNSSLNKINTLGNSLIFEEIKNLTKENGGVLNVKMVSDYFDTPYNHALFALEASPDLKRVKGYQNLADTYFDKSFGQKEIIAIEEELEKILRQSKKALSFKKLVLSISKSLNSKTVKSLINSSRTFAFDWKKRIGLSTWREINPKSARDKAFFVLKKEDKPLHFTHIALLIEKESFAGKNPTAATVHNELILDKRFVLVGRGIYALREWGFKGGTVEEVIEEVLKKNPKGLDRDQVAEEVLKTKMVARNTIMMNLLVKDKFQRDKTGRYRLTLSKK